MGGGGQRVAEGNGGGERVAVRVRHHGTARASALLAIALSKP